MIAIVLTYDRNSTIAGHMMACYRETWPDYPFTFRIPYNQIEPSRSMPCCEYIKTPADIKATVLALIQDLDDEEWIYWCIDDKYPIRLELNPVRELYKAINKRTIPAEISGVLFCRARRMLDPDYLTGEEVKVGNELLLERKAYHQIWVHQFVKAGVIRHLFSSFPDVIERAEIMDGFKDKLVKPATHKLYVTANNYAVFGESTLRGVITENCLESLKEKGFQVPGWHNTPPASKSLIGKL